MRNRATWRAKFLAFVACVMLAVSFSTVTVRPARAQYDAVFLAIIAAVQTWMQTIQWAFEKYYIVESYMTQIEALGWSKKADKALTEQVAANTTALESALQQHVAVLVETEKRSLEETLHDKNQRAFGSFGTVNVGGQSIGIGSVAPTACMRTKDAVIMHDALADVAQVRDLTREVTSNQNQGYGTRVGATAAMASAAESAGGSEVFSMDWITQTALPPEKVDKARKAIAFATNPLPMVPTPRPNTAAGREYTVRAAALREQMELPQAVLGRQLALRADDEANSDGSVLGLIDHWAEQGVANRLSPAALQAKTKKGVLVEIALTMHALLYVENERMKSDQERNAMLAMMLSQRLQDDQKGLRADYRASLRGD